MSIPKVVDVDIKEVRASALKALKYVEETAIIEELVDVINKNFKYWNDTAPQIIKILTDMIKERNSYLAAFSSVKPTSKRGRKSGDLEKKPDEEDETVELPDADIQPEKREVKNVKPVEVSTDTEPIKEIISGLTLDDSDVFDIFGLQ